MFALSQDKTRRIYRFHQFGGPESLTLERDSPAKPGAGEVLIRVEALGLNRADILWLACKYIERATLPSKLGYEIAGTVEEAGEGGTEWKPGDRVSSIPAFSLRDYANFAETTVLPARALVRTPEGLSATEGASFSMAFFTAYFALVELARLGPSQTVLITAATSSTGLAAISTAKRLGARVIATTRTSGKRAALNEAGADHVIATEEEDLIARVRELTDGKGADVIYDAVAGGMASQLAEAVRVRGIWIVYGLLDMDLKPFPWLVAFSRSFRFHVYTVFEFTGNRLLGLLGDEEAVGRARGFIASGFADGTLSVKVDREFRGLESLPEAMKYMASNQAAGKIVITL